MRRSILSLILATILTGCGIDQSSQTNQSSRYSITPIAQNQSQPAITESPTPSNGTSPTTETKNTCLNQTYQKYPPVLMKTSKSKIYSLCYTGFVLAYSAETRTPLWVAEKLTKKRLSQDIKREDSFKDEDSRIDLKDRALLEHYRGSGYDRGHMAPNADMPDKQSQSDSFYLTNMVPQTPNSNQNDWREIEEAIRKLVKTIDRDTFVITGPAFLDKKDQNKYIPCDKIDRNSKQDIPAQHCDTKYNKVQIPSHTYKAVYFTSPKGKAYISAYLVSNTRQPTVEVMSVCELEKKINIQLFPNLDEATKRLVYDLPLKASQVKSQPPTELKAYKGKCAAVIDENILKAEQQKFKSY